MKKYLALLVIVLIVAAYLAGYWPERQRRLAAEGQAKALQAQLDDAQARVRLGGLLARLLTVMDAVGEKNYGQAQALSSAFFDQVREESARAPQAGLKDALEVVLKRRDAVTAGLTQADPAVFAALRQCQTELRNALGYPPATMPSAAPAATAPAAGASPSPSPKP